MVSIENVSSGILPREWINENEWMIPSGTKDNELEPDALGPNFEFITCLLCYPSQVCLS